MDEIRTDRPSLSVVAPVYCEEDGLAEFVRRCRLVLDGLQLARGWEMLIVDDGSSDKSFDNLKDAASGDGRVRVIRFSRNFGHQAAITAGLDFAEGDAVVLIDSDLQDPPEVIVEMVAVWEGGADVVYGVRSARAGETAFKVLSAKIFYRLLAHLSDFPIALDAGDFRLLDRKVVLAMRQLREENRYLRGMVSWLGFRQVPVTYVREPRQFGSTSYSLRKMMRLAINGITGFSERPLRLALHFGAFITFLSMAYLFWVIIGKIVNPGDQIPGYASLVCLILFIGGVQLVCVGMLGEYVGRIHREIKRRPLYVIDETVNLSIPQDFLNNRRENRLSNSE